MDYYAIMRSKIRRNILLLLYIAGEMSAKDLRDRLNLSVGSLYYHLEFLRPFIEQTHKKRYALNELGKRVAAAIADGRDHPAALTKRGRLSTVANVATATSLSGISERIASNPVRYSPLALILLAIYLILPPALDIKPLIFNILPGSGILQNFFYSCISITTIVVYYLVAGIAASMRFGGEAALVVSTVSMSFPMILYILYIYTAWSIGILTTAAGEILSKILYVAALVWQIIVYSGSLSMTKGLGWERSFIVSLLLAYISLFILQHPI